MLIEIAAFYAFCAVVFAGIISAGLWKGGRPIRLGYVLIGAALWPLALWQAVFGNYPDLDKH